MIPTSGGKKIIRSLIMLGLVLLMGILGYMILEGWPFLEALYMTVITITTVGYGETRNLDEPGRIFTIFLIFMGMGIMAYTLGIVAQTITKPAVTDFLEFTTNNKDMDLKMEELLVGERSRLNGLTLIDSGIRQEMNVIIVAIRKSGGGMAFNPSSQTHVESGDTLIALGHTKDLDRLASILAGG